MLVLGLFPIFSFGQNTEASELLENVFEAYETALQDEGAGAAEAQLKGLPEAQPETNADTGATIPNNTPPWPPDYTYPGTAGAGPALISPAAAPLPGTFNINLPLGGGSIDPGHNTSILIFGEGVYEQFTGNAAGLDSAISWLTINGGGSDFVLYLGTSVIASATARSSGFSGLSGSVGTLVITGSAADPTPATPAPATSAANSGTSVVLSGGETSFGCNITLRNIQYTLGTIYMRGNDLTLSNRSWATAATSYYGGAASGSITASPVMTVFSTGTGAANFVGGMYTGTLTGNVATNIRSTSGNIIHVYGAGYGTSATSRAILAGNATTTITGIHTATAVGGLGLFYGGGQFCDVQGTITNNISGIGRYSNIENSTTWNVYSQFRGGSRDGTIGLESYRPTYVVGTDVATGTTTYKVVEGTGTNVITNNVDTSAWTYGSAYFAGANDSGGTVNGNVSTTLKAGMNSNQGSYNGFSGGSAPAGIPTGAGSAWSTQQNMTVANRTLTVTGVNNARSTLLSTNSFKLYGNTTSYITSGCITAGTGDYYVRGGGFGYQRGNAYIELGTVPAANTQDAGLVWGAVNGSRRAFTYGTTSQVPTGTGFDIAGGGGTIGNNNSYFIDGNTTVVTNQVIAHYTYGGNFTGTLVGDMLRISHGGVVATHEGSGFQGRLNVGNSRSEVYGGQIDWFLSGGGWNDNFQTGDASVEVFDGPHVWVNASMGGTYGAGSHVINGNTYVTVRGGHFEGSAHAAVYQGFSGGASNNGDIFGNSTVTIDLRGNQHGFSLSANDAISGGRRLAATDSSTLGRDNNSTITLNIFADPGSVADLNGLNIYGDAALNPAQTYAGQITININAPGSNIGNVYASTYSNINGGSLRRNVEINLVSAGNINGLSAGNPTDNITNTIAASSAALGRYAVLNVGPQSADPNNALGNWQPGLAPNGYPHQINVNGNGINNFTSMEVSDRLIIAQSGNIKNGASATASNHGSTYHQFGDITLHGGSGLGIGGDSAVFIAGALRVEGEAYVASPGARDQVVLSGTNLNPHDESNHITWLRQGATAASSIAPTSYFGVTSAWPVITISPTGSNAGGFSPTNFTGVNPSTGTTYIGDNVAPASGHGYGVCLAGTAYRWQVTSGLGSVLYSIPNASSLNIGTTQPAVGHLDVYGTSMPNTPSEHGTIAIPYAKIPTPVGYPEFTFTPHAASGSWVKYVDIIRSDHHVASPVGANDYHFGEQSLADYRVDPGASFTWGPTADDTRYSFAIAAGYTAAPRLTASSVILREREAQALIYSNVVPLPAPDYPELHSLRSGSAIIAGIYGATGALGRPFLADDMVVLEAIAALGEPLGPGVSSRVYEIEYATHSTSGGAKTLSKTVFIVVVPNDAQISDDGRASLVAFDTTMRVPDAQGITAQNDGGTPPGLAAAHLDTWTGAQVLVVDHDDATDTDSLRLLYPSLDDAAVKIAAFGATTAKSSIALGYSYLHTDAVGGSELLAAPVTAYILGGSFTGTLWEDLNGNGIIDATETARFAGMTVELYRANGTLLASTTTATDGSYAFGTTYADAYEISEGSYYVQFPSLLPLGITAPYDATLQTADLVVSWAGTHHYTQNAGYKMPGGLDALNLSKTVWDGTGFGDSFTVTNKDIVLEYRLQFTLPVDPVDLAGFQTLLVTDLLPAGLVYASAEVNPFVIRLGGTSASTGTAYPVDVGLLTVDDGLVSYLFTDFMGRAGQTINIYIKCKLQKVGTPAAYPAQLINTVQLLVNEVTPPASEEDFTLDVPDLDPVITFTELPLVFAHTPGVSHVLTADELKDSLRVTDAEDYPAWLSNLDGRAQDLYTTMEVTPMDEANLPTTINTMHVGVYKVRYVATDSAGNTTTEYRAVVIDDGRYLIVDEAGSGTNDLIIGAKHFVINQVEVVRSVAEIARLSWAEAYDVQGTALTLELAGGIPAGYTNATAAVGDYPFVWRAVGYTTEKPITGRVVVADVIDSGGKDSHYALYASNFMVNIPEAVDVVAYDLFVIKAGASVFKLLDLAPTLAAFTFDHGGFTDVQGTYPLIFTIGDPLAGGISATLRQAQVNGVVLGSLPPVLTASSPVNIWIGTTAKPVGAIDPGDWDEIYQVSAVDPDGGGKNPNVPLNIIADVVVTGDVVDVTQAGVYRVHYEVTDAELHSASVSRLVVVNDGRYEVSTVPGGRVLFAQPFVILSSDVAADLEREGQVRDLTAPRLYAGAYEPSSGAAAGDVLSASLISFSDLGGYSAALGVYDVTVNAVDYPPVNPPLERVVQAEVVDAEVIELVLGGETDDSYFIFGNNIALNSLAADAIQASSSGLESQLLLALAAGARKTDPAGSLSTLGVKVLDFDGFDSRVPGTLTGEYSVVIADADENVATTLQITVFDNREIYLVSYYSAGHTSGSAPAAASHLEGSTVIVQSAGSLQRTGYTFAGWALGNPNGSTQQDVSHRVGTSIIILSHLNLHAVWVQDVVVPPPPPPPPPPPTPPPITNIPPPVVTVHPPVVITHPPAPPLQVPLVAPPPPAEPSEPEYRPAGPTTYEAVPGDVVYVETTNTSETTVGIRLQQTPEGGMGGYNWSLANLICLLLLLVTFFISLVRLTRRTQEASNTCSRTEGTEGTTAEAEAARPKHSKTTRGMFIMGIAVTFAALLLFTLTQDLSLNMTLVDTYTVIFIALLVLGIISTVAVFMSISINKVNQLATAR